MMICILLVYIIRITRSELRYIGVISVGKEYKLESSAWLKFLYWTYSQMSNIRCTKSPNLNVSHLILKLSSPGPLKPGVQSRMLLEQHRMLQLHLSEQQFL